MVVQASVILLIGLASQVGSSDDELQYKDLSKRARELCGYNEASDKLECRDLEIFNILKTKTTTAPDGVIAFGDTIAEDGCIKAFSIDLKAGRDLSIEWSQSAFSINGSVAQAVPGYSRRITDHLAQRVAFVPAGSILSESVFTNNGDCLIAQDTLYELTKARSEAYISLRVTTTDGEGIELRKTYKALPATEKEALLHLELAPAEIPAEFSGDYFWTTAGIVGGSSVAALVAYPAGKAYFSNPTEATQRSFLGYVATGLIYPALFGGVGFIFDYSNNKSKEEHHNERRDEAILRSKEYNAWVKQTVGETQAH